MEYRQIEVKVHCAKDLKDVNVFSKMDVYVIGSVSGDPRSMQRTMIDKDGGTNPKWNHVMKFAFDESAARLNRLGLVFQIMSNRTLGDKEVGRVYVPLKDLFDAVGVGDDTSNEVLDMEKHVVYQVQTLTGKFRGEFEFSFKFGEIYTQSIEQRLEEPIMAYPAMVPISGLGPNPMQPELTPKLGTSTYPGPSVSGAPYSHSALLLGYPPQNNGYGYGYGCGFRYTSQHMPPMYPNPHTGYAYGNGYPGAYGYTPQAQSGHVQQPMTKQKSKLGLGAAGVGVGVGVGLLGGLLVGEMVEDMAEVVAYDDMFGF